MEFQTLQRRLRKTVVFVTHDISEALLLGDRIGLMEDGRLRALYTPKEFLSSTDDVARRYIEILREGQMFHE